ncbi:MAG: S46 family peptidase [Flavobacteriia bacterium]|nr:S46 family peptidase [Flavobacteriia bacterium]
MKNILFSLILFLGFFVRADEGMWFLMFIERLNQRDMEKLGLQLTADEIYSINHSSLKDAVVQFNGGCTAELISSKGLVLTNHHCGYDAIAELSTPEKNHLINGFWAANPSEELKPKSLYVRFFVRMADVSKQILGKVNDQMTEAERDKTIKEEIALIEKEQSENGKYVVNVRSFFQGNEYYYFVFQDYKDVRLVGTPPESIGKFGGDTDNWEWPRHTGDFSMFRIYADANGNPAEYSPNNVPLTPKVHLKINLKGVQEGDFAMILGFPGRTNRWLPAAGIEQNVKYAYPAWVEASKTSMDAMKSYMDKDDKVNLDYASKYARIANYWKNRQGMIDALTKFETSKTKALNEAKFDAWAQKKKNRNEYGNVIATINKYYAATNEKARHDNYLSILLRSSELATISRTLGGKLVEFDKSDKNKTVVLDMLKAIDEFYEKLSFPVEKDILMNGVWLYTTKAGYKLPATFDSPDAISQRIAAILVKTVFSNPDQLRAYVRGEQKIDINKDPLFMLSQELIAHLSSTTPEMTQMQADFARAYRKLVKGMRESGLSEIQYPDANSTMRLTYGKVSALPADKRNDATVNYYTTLQGTINKYKPNDQEFDLPQRLIELNKTQDFGEYADKKGYMPVNFLTNNDITGGNSGSPVLNGRGELIGLAFDGNIEAMAGDVIFDDMLQKTINVDIRYVLFLIDKFSGARHIVNEMTIIR